MALTATQLLYATGGAAAAGIASLTTDGTNVTATSGVLRFTRPQITTSLDDSSGNELIKFTATGSAVNELTIANAATGGSPTISATGSDSNIGITVTPKGSGVTKFANSIMLGTSLMEIGTRDDVTMLLFGGTGAAGGVVGVGLSYNKGLAIASGAQLLFTSDTFPAAGVDIAMKRNAAGVIEVNNGVAGTYRDLKLRQLIADATVTAGGTTGAQTINKGAGTVNFAAAATSLVVTNSLVTASSIIMATIRTNDATMTSVQVVAASGSFTIYANAAATAETSVGFVIVG